MVEEAEEAEISIEYQGVISMRSSVTLHSNAISDLIITLLVTNKSFPTNTL